MLDEVARYYYVFKDDYESFHLLSEIEKYVNGVEIQTKRIEKFKNQMNKQAETRILSHDQLFLDCHFYFICLDKIEKFFDKLSSKLNNAGLKKLRQEFKSSFDVEIRHDLEHLDERVLGLKFSKVVKNQQWRRDFLNFYSSGSGDFLSFGGKKFAVGNSELKKLKIIFKKLISIIHKEYALRDIDFVNRLGQEKRIRSTLKALKTARLIT